MRKIFALVLALTLLTVPLYVAIATEVGLSGMTNEELAALKQQLDAEMLDRGMVKTAVLPNGYYTIGVDIPAGTYILSQDGVDESGYYFLFETESDMKTANFYSSLNIYSPTQVKVTLPEGHLLQIVTTSTMKITDYSLQWN